ncbi:response regulator [Echinicola sediminis]
MAIASIVLILFLAYFFYDALSNNLLANSRQFLSKQVEIASNEVQRKFNAFHEDLTYYTESIELDSSAGNVESKHIFEGRTRRLLNSYSSLVDTLFVQVGDTTQAYLIRDNNYFEKVALSSEKEFADLERYVVLTSHVKDIRVAAAISIHDFFNDYASNHYLGEGGHKFYFLGDGLWAINGGSDAKDSVVFSEKLKERIKAEYSGGLLGVYEGQVQGLSEGQERFNAVIAQYPFNLPPLQTNYALIFAKDKGVIISKIYNTYFLMFAGLFVLLLLMIYVMIKHFRGINSKNAQLEKKSEKINRLFQQQTMLLQESNGFVYYVTSKGEVSDVSDNLVDVLGYTKGEFKAHFRSYVLQEDLARFEQEISKAVEEKSDHLSFELGFIKKDGSVIRTKTYEHFFYTETGEFNGSIGICTDINEKYLAEQEVVKSEDRLRAVLNSLPDIIFIYDHEGIFQDYYVQNQELLLMPPKDSIGKHISDVIPAPENTKLIKAFNKALETGRIQTEEMTLDIKGNKKVFEIRFFKLDEERMMSLGREVTQQRIWEKGLREAKEMAEGANRAKSEFLASMSHEIRTPMNGLLGMIGLLESTPLTEEQQEFLNVIKDSGASLLAIIKDILDYSKIEEGKLELYLVKFNFKQEINKVTKIFAGLLAAKELALELTVEDSVPEWIVLDKEKLNQILFNIIGNAIKFTPKGGHVSVRVYGEQVFEKSYMIYFSVKDTGIGIPKEKIDWLIHPFTQAGTGSPQEKSGSGLGLAIANKLIELMGGRLEIRSERGEGAEFSFTVLGRVPGLGDGEVMSSEADTTPEKSLLNMADKYPLAILLVEDNDINRKFMKLLMGKLGYEVDTATNGKEAIKAAKEKDYDLIFMDYQMPVMNGLEASRSLREMENGESVRIIGLSANAFKEDIEQAFSAGMDDYLTKPIKINEVVKKIKEGFQPNTK